MENPEEGDDVSAINDIIERQFGSLTWSSGASADWDTFFGDFFPDAALYPAARPAKRQSVEAFAERLGTLAKTKLDAFHEKVLGTDVRVFGNVAVALAGCEITENGTEVNRGVEMLLLIKDEGRWRIVAQGWDMASAGMELPADLASAEAG